MGSRHAWPTIYDRKPLFERTGSEACISQPELFFSFDRADLAQARIACGYCPLMNICRLEGLKNKEHGVWGGLTKDQRTHMGPRGRAKEIARLEALLQS